MGIMERLLHIRTFKKKRIPCVNSLDMTVIERYLAAEQKYVSESPLDMHTNFYQNSHTEKKDLRHLKPDISPAHYQDSLEHEHMMPSRYEGKKISKHHQSIPLRTRQTLLTSAQSPRDSGRSRVTFDETIYESETYSWELYDRKAIDCKQTQSVMEVYAELMKFKLCEMIIHEDSIHNVNQHISRATSARQREMTGILALILSEYDSVSG